MMDEEGCADEQGWGIILYPLFLVACELPPPSLFFVFLFLFFLSSFAFFSFFFYFYLIFVFNRIQTFAGFVGIGVGIN